MAPMKIKILQSVGGSGTRTFSSLTINSDDTVTLTSNITLNSSTSTAGVISW